VPNFLPYCFVENERTVGIPSVPKPAGLFGCPGPMLKGWKLEGILPGLMQKAVAYIDPASGVPRPQASILFRAMARAFRVPTTTSFRPKVMAVYSRFRWSIA